MRFRPSILDFCRATIAGLVCVVSVAVSRGGEPVQVVPPRGTEVQTNIEQSQATGTKNFESMGPHAPRSFHLAAPSQTLPLPFPQQQAIPLSEREKELQDLRKNWVFMTPDDMVGQAESDLSGFDKDKDGLNKKATTAMERYYQHLYDSDHSAATNQGTKLDSDSWTGATNSVVGDSARPNDGLFGTTPDTGVFQSPRATTFSDVFGSSANTAQSSAETIRLQEAQKEHMESFKQLWDIDQPATPPAVASEGLPKVSSPTPAFGSAAGDQPAINAFNSSLGGLSGQAPASPIIPTITSSRNIQPPRATFAPPQREF
ncbi:MAG TPA: hypothetical protein VH597_13185 [Verrucomicrobiae bacterium]|jgi:hypothetical protein|nr:hypothetical protein [Verrucomicrobiae bacterium]